MNIDLGKIDEVTRREVLLRKVLGLLDIKTLQKYLGNWQINVKKCFYLVS